jgi:hypothetical protein
VASDRGITGDRNLKIGEGEQLDCGFPGHYAIDELGLVLDASVGVPIADLIGGQSLQLGFIGL